MKVLLKITAMLSAFGIIGTIGAFDTESITAFHTFIQLAFSGFIFWTSVKLMKRSRRNALKRIFCKLRPRSYSGHTASEVA